MIPTKKPKILIVDLEATCSKDKSIPREEMEIIEIGAIKVDHDLNLLGKYQNFVKPVRNSTLTEFCTELTTISQVDVDNASGFPEVISQFADDMIGEPGEVLFTSWGRYDKNQLRQDCRYHGVTYPFDKDHLDVKRWVAKQLGIKPQKIHQVLEHLDLEFEGTQHRALVDVENILRILLYMKKQNVIERESK